MVAKILVIEDEPALGRGLKEALSTAGYRTEWVPSGEAALDWLKNQETDLVIADVRLPGIDGLEVLSRLASEPAPPATIVMTAHGDIRTAVKAMKLGAEEFLPKPIDLHALLALVERTIKRRRNERALAFHKSEAITKYGLHTIIGRCEAVNRAREMVKMVASLGEAVAADPPNVFITGETGTGKDLLARAFHVEGPRAANPFVHVNCAALPETLVESELFGHVKGAFTDAKTGKLGLFEQANDGTLYLDELHQLPAHVQAKLLTAIESRAIRQVGGVDERPVRVHIIAAINEPVEQSLASGKLRQDLFHRLRVIQVHLPPVRDRGDDIELLIQHYLKLHCDRLHVPLKTLSPEALGVLKGYHWPGNIREMHHWIESAVLQAGASIEKRHLPIPLGQRPGTRVAGGAENRINIDWSAGPIMLEELERDLLKGALDKTQGNLSQAAKLLGLTRYAMRYRAAKYGIL